MCESNRRLIIGARFWPIYMCTTSSSRTTTKQFPFQATSSMLLLLLLGFNLRICVGFNGIRCIRFLWIFFSFFLFNSFKETFERVGNTNCILMFWYFLFFFFLFSQMKRYNKEVLGLGSKSYFFLTGQVNFFVQSVYKVVQVLGFCEKP